MTYYPVGIPTLCRYEHFKRCVESLSRNTHADKTELVVGLDFPPSEKYREGYDKISKYVDTIEGFAKVTIFRHEKNLGAVGNFRYIERYIYGINEAAIMTEDDNEFAPNFLDYMDKALSRFKNDPNVLTISGYCHPDFEYDGDIPACFSYEVSAWGIGMWRDKQILTSQKECQHYFEEFLKNKYLSIKIMRMCPTVFNMLPGVLHYHLCDVQRGIYNMIEGTTQVRPTKSLVKNWGYDGSGINCGVFVDERVKKQGLPKNQYFNLTEELLQANSDTCLKFYRNFNVPKTLFRRYKYYFAVIRNYLFYLYKQR